MSIVDDPPATTSAGQAAPPEAPSPVPEPAMLPPLVVSALMVTKADLIAALRVYLPHLTDVEAIDGGERFLLSVAGPQDGEGSD